MRVVYVDVLFILNLYITVLQAAAAARLCRVRVKGWRLLLGGAAGGAASLLYFMDMSPLASAAVNLLCALAIVLIAIGFGGGRAFFRRVLTFVGTGMLLAGLVVGLQLLLRPADPFYSNGAVYFEVSPLVLIGVTAVSYLLLRIFDRLTAKPATKEPASMTIGVDGRSVVTEAIIDSGNLLRDTISGAPVAIVELSVVRPLFPGSEATFFETLDPKLCPAQSAGRMRVIPCQTVTGSRLLAAFRPDKVSISSKGRQLSADDLIVAVTTQKLASEYKALLPDCVLKP